MIDVGAAFIPGGAIDPTLVSTSTPCGLLPLVGAAALPNFLGELAPSIQVQRSEEFVEDEIGDL